MTPSLPPYLTEKLAAFYQGRWARDWRGRHIMRGRRPRPGDLCLMSNDYLALAGHPHIVAAQRNALDAGAEERLMSAIFLHGDEPQGRLEARFAAFLGAGEVVLCQSGYNANLGLLQALLEDTGVPVYVDLLAHMSLWDGVRLAGATAHRFRHNDVEHLLRQIRRHGPGVVLVDSVYSTDGSLCPLAELAPAVIERGCTLVVDESHALGTHGPGGRGLVAALGLEDQVLFRTASLAKALAGRAGLVAGPAGFADWFRFTSKPAIFSSALLGPDLAALDAALDLVEAGAARRRRLAALTARLRAGLAALGYPVARDGAQIIALEAGEEWRTIVLRDALEARGVFGSPFCAPATPRQGALIRLSLHAGLDEAAADWLLAVCAEIREAVELDRWRGRRRRGLRAAA